MKKFATIILCLLFSLITLCACSPTYETSWLKHNYERDYSQVIVKIAPITESGKRNDGTEWSYTSDEVEIYKSQLVSYINNYGLAYVQNGYMTQNEMVDYFIEQLTLTELVVIAADLEFEKHNIFWTKEDIDGIQQSVYSYIDAQLLEIYNEILTKSGKDTMEKPESSTEDASTTYPVKPDEEVDEDRVFSKEDGCTYGTTEEHEYEDKDGKKVKFETKKHDAWYFDERLWFTFKPENFNSFPGQYGDSATKSLAREGVKRLVTHFADTAKDLIGLSDADKKQIEKEVADLKKTIADKGVAYAYRDLGKTLLIKKLVGDNYIISAKMDLLQDYIESTVTVDESEVVDMYNKMLADQQNTYANASAYDSAATGNELILYRPNDNYIYVKHILIPFSDKQRAELEEYKAIYGEDEYIIKRNNKVNDIVAYAHVNGEDDKTSELSVLKIFNEVRAAVERLSADPGLAERAFDDFTYKYSTDTASVGSEYGYAVKYKLNSGEGETYMQEFADAARAFRDEGYTVGHVYDNYVVTDYGVHIMYYAADYKEGDTLRLDSFATPAGYTSVRKTIEDKLYSSKVSGYFNKWQSGTIDYYRNTRKVVTNIEKAYKDLYAKD